MSVAGSRWQRVRSRVAGVVTAAKRSSKRRWNFTPTDTATCRYERSSTSSVQACPNNAARSRRTQSIFVISVIISSFAATWLGLASVFPDLASAIVGAAGLAASPTVIIAAVGARRTGATIDDLLRNARGDHRHIGHPIDNGNPSRAR